MKKSFNIKNLISVCLLIVLTVVIAIVGYRVVVTADELPGKLGSVSVAAANTGTRKKVLNRVQKVSYDTMKYGYMDDLLLAQMDVLDKEYENERLEEIRRVNDLTAMRKKTLDKLAYEAAKKQLEEEAEKARQAAAMAEAARQARVQALIAAKEAEKNGDVINVDTGDDSDPGKGDTASKGGKKGKPVYADSHGKSLGKFVITAYCTCRVCCGVYSGGNRTASGTVPTSNRTIAVDTNVIPFNTRVVINGQVYVAEDRGGAIKGKRIDMFFMTHKEALRWGRRTMEVYLAK